MLQDEETQEVRQYESLAPESLLLEEMPTHDREGVQSALDVLLLEPLGVKAAQVLGAAEQDTVSSCCGSAEE